MALRPQPGLVFRYSFLWRHEAEKGRLEGVKDRPVMVVIILSKNEEVIGCSVYDATAAGHVTCS